MHLDGKADNLTGQSVIEIFYLSPLCVFVVNRHFLPHHLPHGGHGGEQGAH